MRNRLQQWRDWLRRAPSLLLGALALTLVVPAFVLARHPVAVPDVIYACYTPGSGTIYRIKAPGLRESCTAPTHVEFSWSTQEEPGGLTGVQIVQAFGTIAANSQGLVRATCPTGKVPTGGGFAVGSLFLHVIHSFPESNGWRIGVMNTAPTVDLGATAYAVCATAGS